MPDLSHPPHDLLEELVAQQSIAPPVDVAPLSGGRTNQVWKLSNGKLAWVLKLYRSGQANPLFRNDPVAEFRMMQRLAPLGLAARPCRRGIHAGACWLLYPYQRGMCWRTGTARAAKTLFDIHQVHDLPDLPVGPNGSAALCGQIRALGLTDADICLPHRLVLPTDDLTLVHGDPVPGNLLIKSDGAIFLDWQCPAVGDPCDDLAVFLSPAMQCLYRGAPLEHAEVEAFWGAYGHETRQARYYALAPFFHARMYAYCAWRARLGMPDYAAVARLEYAAFQRSLQANAA